MNQRLINIARKIGIDKAIAYSSGARIIQGISGAGSVFFISVFLTKVEQGFYFTFGSLLGLQVFFELGLTGIMTQFVAHESSHLNLNTSYNYTGEAKYISRLASLVKFCFKWYLVLAFITFAFLLIIGYVFFNKYGNNQNESVDWEIPWLLICLATSIKIFQSPFTSIISGLGYVKDTSKITFYQQLIQPLCIWVGLACGLHLYVVGIGYLISVLIWQFYVFRNNLFNILLKLWKYKVTCRVSYIKEIFPFQWKIALSWISGYFIFQLFNPVLFATEGAVVAGQMGMTLQALSAISSFSMSWINTKIPLFSKLIALKEYIQLDKIFNKTLYQMKCICLLLLFIFFLFIFILKISKFTINSVYLGDRFLSYVPLLFMICTTYINQNTSSWATYLRCHKEEPFLANSVCAGILSLTSTIVGGKLFGLYGVVIGYFIIQLSLLPWAYSIFKTKKREWHKI